MTDIVTPVDGKFHSHVWRLPALRRAPASFRAGLKLAAENWLEGSLTIVLPAGAHIRIEGHNPGPQAEINVHDFRFVSRVLAAGDIGFAEGYMAGEWDTPDLSVLLEAASQNFDRLAKLLDGNPLVRGLNALTHSFNRNSRKGSKRNIEAHYDLGNSFYSQWLDPSMTYSSALFEAPGQSLDAAQTAKYAALARSMNLQSGQSVLEIGCGWGGFAEFAAREVGAQVTAITISKAQAEFAAARLHRQGLSDRASIQLVDYRDVTGQFDKVASIEMFEAVGEAYWGAYFDRIRKVLKPGGQAGLQIITIRDDLFGEYRKRSDFIKKYVFPGGMLPSEQRLRQEVAQAGLTFGPVRRFGQDYAITLRHWAERFEAAWPQISPLGFDERFHRLWRFYLAYCEAGFSTGRTDVIQLQLGSGY
jgi:cyclopropane-fatty-acyl-phospholipid synthase